MKRLQKLFSPDPPAEASGGGSGDQIPAGDGTAAQEKSPTRNRQPWVISLVLAAMVWAVFGQTRHFEFTNFDDPTYVFNNPMFNQGLKWHAIEWSFTHENEHEWFPVTYITRMLDSQLYGANAGGHHVTNVVLHTATVILLFLLMRRMTGKTWPAAFVAAVFAIHPLRVQSVAWVVERKDVLSGLFFMLTLWTWLDYIQARSRLRATVLPRENTGETGAARPYLYSYFLALFLFALGLMSKSMLVTLPCVMLLLDYWPLNRLPLGRAGLRVLPGLVLEKIPFFLLSAAACVTTALTEKNIMLTAHHPPLFWRIGNVLLAYVDYLKHTVYPAGLAVVYPYSDANPPVWNVGVAALILLFISVMAVAGYRKHPWLLVGWFWFLGMLLPVIDNMQSTQNARGDRYTYLPQIGLIILLTWAAVAFCGAWRRGRILLGGVAVIILGTLLVDAYIQTTYWKDSVTLWTRAVECTSQNYFAENSLGSALNNKNRWSEAAGHFEKAIQYNPNDIDTRVNYGVCLGNLGKLDQAITQFNLALQLNPNSADARYGLGHALLGEGKPEAAIPYFQKALQLKPAKTSAHYDLGLALGSQNKWTEAAQHFAAALHLNLDETDAKYILAAKLAADKKWDGAIDLYRQTLQAKPDFAEAHNKLALAMAASGDTAGAVQEFQEALKLSQAQGDSVLADAVRARMAALQSTVPPKSN